MKKVITRERCPFTRCLHNHAMICDITPYPREIDGKTGIVSLYCPELTLPEHIDLAGGNTDVRNHKTVTADRS